MGRRRRGGGERGGGGEGVAGAGASGAMVPKGERAVARGCKWGWGVVWCELLGVAFNLSGIPEVF